jgi:hypothetical protein
MEEPLTHFFDSTRAAGWVGGGLDFLAVADLVDSGWWLRGRGMGPIPDGSLFTCSDGDPGKWLISSSQLDEPEAWRRADASQSI